MKINLAEAKQQYFKLLRNLNKSNEKIKLYFFIDESAPVRKIYAAIPNEQKILLSTTNQFNWWIAVEHTHYESLSQSYQ